MDKPMTFDEFIDLVFSDRMPFGDACKAANHMHVEKALKFAYEARDDELESLQERLDEVLMKDRLKTKEYNILVQENNQMREVVQGFIDTINLHEIVSLSCDRDGETYCECLRDMTKEAVAALTSPKEKEKE